MADCEVDFILGKTHAKNQKWITWTGTHIRCWYRSPCNIIIILLIVKFPFQAVYLSQVCWYREHHVKGIRHSKRNFQYNWKFRLESRMWTYLILSSFIDSHTISIIWISWMKIKNEHKRPSCVRNYLLTRTSYARSRLTTIQAWNQ